MTVHKFAIVVDGDVAGTISIDDTNPAASAPRHIAAYNSDPKIIPVPSDLNVVYGWTYEDGVFVSPTISDTGSGESEVG
jgi:hypothetical protein